MEKVSKWKEVCQNFEIPLPAVALHFALLPSFLIANICVGFKHRDEVEMVVQWLKDQSVPLELWKQALDRKLLAKYAYDIIVTGIYDCQRALNTSVGILNTRSAHLNTMRRASNTIDIKGKRYYDARDIVADFFEEKLEGCNMYNIMTIHLLIPFHSFIH